MTPEKFEVSVTLCQVSGSLFVLNPYLEKRSCKTELAKLILLFNPVILSEMPYIHEYDESESKRSNQKMSTK